MPGNQVQRQPAGKRAAQRGELQECLDKLARAITAGDGKAAAALWEAPAFVIGDEMAMPITELAEAEKFFGGAKEQYNERGIVDTRAEIIDEEWIGDRIVVAKVRWPYLDEAGREVGAERSDYTFRRNDRGELKVRSVLMRGIVPGTH